MYPIKCNITTADNFPKRNFKIDSPPWFLISPDFTQLKFCLFYFGGQINVIVRLEICPHFSVQGLPWGFGSQLPNCIAFRSYEETLKDNQACGEKKKIC